MSYLANFKKKVKLNFTQPGEVLCSDNKAITENDSQQSPDFVFPNLSKSEGNHSSAISGTPMFEQRHSFNQELFPQRLFEMKELWQTYTPQIRFQNHQIFTQELEDQQDLSELQQSSVTSSSNHQQQCLFSFQELDMNEPAAKLECSIKDSVQYIKAEILISRMQLEKNNQNLEEKLLVIDCRYGYEYQGGHINEAVNICEPNEMQELLFGFTNLRVNDLSPLIVLYCEFSQKRSVEFYRWIRNKDRKLNTYPQLTYPEIYILDKGFQTFYQTKKVINHYMNLQQEYCIGKYIPQNCKEFKEQEKIWRNKIKKQWHEIKMQQREKRVKSFNTIHFN